MNHKEDFFSQLDSEFPEHPLKQRYLSELRDHVEDLEEDLNLKTNQLTPELMSKKLGSPKEIKNNFFDVMLPLRHLIFAMESLLWGSLLVPPVIYMVLVISYLNSSPRWLFLAFLTLLGASLFFGLTYQLLLSRSLALEEKLGVSRKIWSWSILLPPLFSLPFLVVSAFNSDGTADPVAFLALMTLMLIWIGLIIFSKKNLMMEWGMSKLTNTGSALPVIVFTLSTLLAIKNMGAKPFPTDDVNLFFLLIPQMFLGPILQIATLSEKFLFIVPIFGLFLILALAGIGFSMLYFRKWLWAQATLAVLIVSFLCAAPFQTQSFLFPYVDLISPIIEQNEFGVFYRLARFWDQTEPVIHYDVDFNNGAFHVRQNLGRTLVFSPEFAGAGFPYMKNITVEVSAPYAEQQYGNTLPESFECLEGGMPENTTTPVICQKFLLEDIYFNYVLGSKNGYDPRGIIHDIAIADDKQTAVVVLSSDFTPEEVYFVDLRPYNQAIQ